LKRLTKTLLALVGLFVVAIVLILLFVNANSFRPAIEKQLTATLGRDVKLGKVSLSLFSWSLIVRDLSIADDPAFSSAPFLTATEVRIGILLWPLIFSHQLNIRSFQIEAPQIIVIRAANGAWNFSSLGRLPASGDPAHDANAQSASGISKGAVPQVPDQLFIGRIVIEAGHAVIGSLPAQGPPRVYEHVNLTARDFSFTSQFAIEGGATLAAGGTIRGTGHVGPINRDDAATSPIDAQISVKHFDPVATGFLDTNTGVSLLADIDMHAASDGQTLTTGGAVHIQNLKLRKNAAATPKPLTITYRGTYRVKENTGQIEDAAVKIGDAAIRANGTFQTITHGMEYPILNLKLVGQNLSIDELQPLMSAAAIRLPNDSMLKSGTLSMNLTITGPAKSLDVTGPITLANTHLVGFDIGSRIQGIAALSGIKTGDTTDFESLRVYVRITGAGVVVDQINATGRGTVSTADQLGFNLTIKGAPTKGISKVVVGLLTKLNGSGSSSGNGSGVPMHVTGTSEEPYITGDVGSIIRRGAG
jgi:AsmA protein